MELHTNIFSSNKNIKFQLIFIINQLQGALHKIAITSLH